MNRARSTAAGAAAALVWGAAERIDRKIFDNDTEHLALFPLGTLVDRYHPARGEPGVEQVFGGRAFAQATVRHALFGVVLGRLAA